MVDYLKTEKIIIVGAGGHARVICDILHHHIYKNIEVVAFIDNVVPTEKEEIMGLPVLGDHSLIPEMIDNEEIKGFIVGVGDNRLRTQYFSDLKNFGLEPINAVHSTAHIASDAKIGAGIVIGAGAIIATESKIEDNSIINTGVIVEHEDVIEKNVHIAPGSIIAGRVKIEEGTFIGAGSIVKDYCTIGKKVIVGAGSVVIENLPDNVVVVGVPAKIIKTNNKSGF